MSGKTLVGIINTLLKTNDMLCRLNSDCLGGASESSQTPILTTNDKLRINATLGNFKKVLQSFQIENRVVREFRHYINEAKAKLRDDLGTLSRNTDTLLTNSSRKSQGGN